MIEQLAGSWNYIIVVILMMTGLFMVIARANLVKKMIGLSIFQTSVFIFYISLGKMAGGTAPILDGNPDTLYSNPLPHVLILTAIVVGVATTALGLALILRINEAFGSVEEDEIIAAKASQSLPRPKRPTSEAAE
ncbi:cation:proton antiporter subunit C [Alphaproteobacteria bacterium]|nr:cation:proton antiporter subunit C [Alphaproteobacteria bacterium]